MPHITVEYSKNIGARLDAPKLLRDLNGILASYETFNPNEIKSRCYRAEDFFMASGEAGAAFVHLRLDIMEGRELALKQELGPRLVERLREAFVGDAGVKRIDVSVEIRDMSRETYFKGRFTS